MLGSIPQKQNSTILIWHPYPRFYDLRQEFSTPWCASRGLQAPTFWGFTWPNVSVTILVPNHNCTTNATQGNSKNNHFTCGGHPVAPTSVDIAIFLHPPLRKTVGVRRVLVGRGRRRERWVQWLQNHPLLPDRWPPTDGGESKNKDKMKFDGSHFSQSKTDGALTTGRHGMYL